MVEGTTYRHDLHKLVVDLGRQGSGTAHDELDATEVETFGNGMLHTIVGLTFIFTIMHKPCRVARSEEGQGWIDTDISRASGGKMRSTYNSTDTSKRLMPSSMGARPNLGTTRSVSCKWNVRQMILTTSAILPD
jgi:hypothetical protein